MGHWEKKDKSCTWHPWKFDDIVSMAKKVSEEKVKISQSAYAPVTKRNKILKYMKDNGTRQEHGPLLGKLVDCAYAEPLHNGNNGWQYLHKIMLEIVLAKSKLPPSFADLDSLQDNSPSKIYLGVLRNDLKVTRLVNKLVRWFKDGRKGAFSYRFTGKETKIFSETSLFLAFRIYSLTRSCSGTIRDAMFTLENIKFMS